MPDIFFIKSRALRDLEGIVQYISRDNPVAARNLREKILEDCTIIGRNPFIGTIRKDLTDRPVRFFAAHHNYMIIYNAESTPVQILRIYNAARDITSILH